MDKVLDLIKAIFGDKKLSFDDLKKELDGKKDEIKLVNLKDGEYVGKDKLETAIRERDAERKAKDDLQTQVKKFEGVDVDALKKQIEDTAKEKDTEIAKVRLESAIQTELLKEKVKDIKDVLPQLDRSILKMEGDDVKGLKEQLSNLKEKKAYLFEEPAKEPDEKTSTTNDKPAVRASMAPDHKQTSTNDGSDARLEAAAGLKPSTTN